MMNRDEIRQVIKFIIWVLLIALLFYIGSILLFYFGGKQSRQNEQQITRLANQQTPIRAIQSYYHLDRGVDSYALKGSDQHGRTYYFLYLPHAKKAYLYRSNQQTKSARQITALFRQSHQRQTIKAINLGWYKGAPAWEVAYQKPNGNLGYTLYSFKDGKEINQVDNL